MEKNNEKSGPACSITSRPDGSVITESLPESISIGKVKELIEAQNPVVIIIDAEWCADCRNQMRNLPKFEKEMLAAGIGVYIFTVEGPNYDVFISPEHKALAMKLYSTPVGSRIFSDKPEEKEDITSVMAVRGREGYPAIFFISKGAVQHWSIEDVSIKQLDLLSQTILKK